MVEFNIEKKGYDKEQVDEYIEKLGESTEKSMKEQRERIVDLKKQLEQMNDELKQNKIQSESVSNALIFAMQTAAEIENNSKILYQAEIERIRNLYDKWESFLNAFMDKYPEMKKQYDKREIMKKFSLGIQTVLEKNSLTIKAYSNSGNESGLQSLLSKMATQTDKKTIMQEIIPAKTESENIEKIKTEITPKKINHSFDYTRFVDMDSKQKELKKKGVITNLIEPNSERLTENTLANSVLENSIENPEIKINLPKKNDTEKLKSQVKPITNLKLSPNDEYESLVDKFLSGEGLQENNAYSKAILKRSHSTNGFDINEAIHPTQSLEEIMNNFDFFKNKKEDK